MGRKEVHNTGKESCVKLVDREGQTANQAGENYLIKNLHNFYIYVSVTTKTQKSKRTNSARQVRRENIIGKPAKEG
jgi:hypothetical protein